MNEEYISVSDIKPFLKNINILLIIVNSLIDHERMNDDFLLFQAADHTGSVHLSCPNEIGKFLKPGDIVRIKSGYSATVKGSLQLNAGRVGSIKRVGSYFLCFSEKPNMSTVDMNKKTTE